MGIVVQNNTGEKTAVEFIVKKHDKLKQAKQSWESHWKEITRYFLPNKQDVWGGATPGQKWGQELFDAIGVRSTEKLASALHSMLTNPSVMWFGFSSGNHAVDSLQENAKWLQDSAKVIFSILNNSNFQPEIHEAYMDLCSIHTSHLTVEEDEVEIVKFKSLPIFTAAIAENYKGSVDTVYYEAEKTVTQLIEEYGAEALPEEVRQIQFTDPLKKFCIIQAIEPTANLPKSLQHEMLPFTSLHILKEAFVVLKKGGFEENPCIVSRFHKLSGEMYGRGPAMYALPHVKSCNQMMKTWLEGAQLAINPPLQLPDEGVLLPVKLTPGGVNYYRADSKDRIEPIITGANPGVGHQIIELLHKEIEEFFYINQLQLVENDRMTATEVMQRKDENLRFLSPIIGRLMYELHAPIILRVFGIATRRGLIPPIPQGLRQAKLEVKFVSQLARAHDTIEAENTLRAFQVITSLAQIDPTVMDYVDMSKHAKFFYKNFGSNLDLLRKDQEVKQLQEQRAQAQAQAQQAQLDQMNSQSMKNVAQAEQVQ